MKKEFNTPEISIVKTNLEHLMVEMSIEEGTGPGSGNMAAKEETWGFGFDDLEEEE